VDWAAMKARIKVNIHQTAGDDTGSWDDSEYLAVANDKMRTVVSETGCLDSEATFNSVANQGEYREIVDVNKIKACYFDDGNGFVPLERTSLEELDRFDKEGHISSPWREERGDPVAWYPDIPREVIGFYPIPDANGTNNLQKRYREQVTEMTVAGSIPFNEAYNLYDYHRLIVYAVSAHFLGIDGENPAFFLDMYDKGIRGLKRKLNQDYRPITFSLVSRKRSVKRSVSWPLGH